MDVIASTPPQSSSLTRVNHDGFNDPMKEILQYLEMHGEQLDTEIATATGISLVNVHLHLSQLVARGEVMACRSIKFEKDRKIEGISCRIVGYIPPAARSKKPKVQLKLS